MFGMQGARGGGESQQFLDAVSEVNTPASKVLTGISTVITIATLVIACMGITGGIAQMPMGASMAGLAGGGLLVNTINAANTRHNLKKATFLLPGEIKEMVESGVNKSAATTYASVVVSGLMILLGALTATGFIAAATLGWIYVGTILAGLGLGCCCIYCVCCCGGAALAASANQQSQPYIH